MKGDFTRGFNPDRKRGQSYRRVLLQQGRALLDSDIAAMGDAIDTGLRDTLRMTACHAGSPDLGLLVTPGRLLAQFDGNLGNAFTLSGGAEAVRDYGHKYLDRLPGLRIGGTGGAVTVALAAPLAAATAIRLWVRADNGGASATLNGTAIALPAGPAFQAIDTTASGATLTLSVDPAARYWVALIETRADAGQTPVLHSAPGSYEIDGLPFRTAGGAWPSLADPAGAALASQAQSGTDTRLVAYVEAHERHITAIEDAGILETALGGDIDTTTRTRTTHQVKLARVGAMTPEAIIAAFARPDLPGGTVRLGVANETVTPDPCDLPVPGGYTGPENRLYRIEVHGEGPGGATLFKWSRENGSELFAARFPDTLVIPAPASSLVVQADADLRDGDLVELLSEATELGDDAPATLSASGLRRPRRAAGRLLRLSGGEEITGSNRIFDLLDPVDETPVTDVDTGRFGAAGLKIRRWSGLIRHSADGIHPLEQGIEADIAGSFEPGDWWQYEARTGGANANGPTQPDPHGPERLFAPLAVLRQTPAGQPMVLESWLDSRFPRLCAIEADDVSYDGGRVGSDSGTVQEALDELFERATGGCGDIPVPEGADIRDYIDAIPDGGDARICLGPFTRDIPSVIEVANKGHITLTGIGLGTLLQAERPTFRFRNCRAVTLQDFTIRTSGTGNSILRIEDCGTVDIDRITILSSAEAQHGTAAIRIDATRDGAIRYARVRDCHLLLGLNDTGVLSLGVLDLAVKDCEIVTREERMSIRDRLTDDSFASRVGRVFLSQLSFNVDTNIFVGGSDVDLDYGGDGRRGVALAGWGRLPVRFSTHGEMRAFQWDQIATANRPGINPATQAHMRTHIRRVRRGITRFALGLAPGDVTIPTAVGNILRQIGSAIAQSADMVYGHAGIIVAAPRGPVRRVVGDPSDAAADPLAQTVQISGNRIRGFYQGVRVGASNAATGGPSGRVALFGDVEVDGNRIDLTLPMFERSRWGIFVGSSVSVTVRNNRVTSTDTVPEGDNLRPLSPTDGIRVWGHFGALVQIERNTCLFTTNGVRFRPLTPIHDTARTSWKVSDGFGDAALPANGFSGPGRAEIVEIPT